MSTLTLTINLDDCETAEGEGKFEGYTFLNNVKGRFQSIKATDAEGHVWSVKTLFLAPIKAPKAEKKADAKTVRADVMAQMLDMMKSIKAENESIKAELAARKPLTRKIPGLAQPAIQVLASKNGATNGTHAE